MNGQIVDTIPTIPSLEGVPGAYAVYVSGDSMEPRYMAGEALYVHPNRPVRRGDYVVIQIRNAVGEPPLGFVKRYVTKTPTVLIVSQFNPAGEIEFPIASVVSVHRVVGSCEV